MLSSALIQLHFDDACPAWHPNLTEKKTKKKIQIMQNKCIRFCLTLDKMHHISGENFRSTNLLPNSKRVDQCLNTITLKLFDNTCPYYLKEIFEFALLCRIDTRNKFANFKTLFARQTWGRKLFHSLVLLYGTFYLN